VIIQKNGSRTSGFIVYQRSGDTLSALYTGGTPAQVARLTDDLAHKLSKELDATKPGTSL
jgi:hypothetical protein